MIIAIIAAIGIGLVVIFLLTKKNGTSVVVSIDGKEIERYGLNENVDTEIEGVGGKNRLIIRDGEAWIEEADCPDKLCVKQGRISHTNESIVCLPHRITVRVIGESDENTPDAVVSEQHMSVGNIISCLYRSYLQTDVYREVTA